MIEKERSRRKVPVHCKSGITWADDYGFNLDKTGMVKICDRSPR